MPGRRCPTCRGTAPAGPQAGENGRGAKDFFGRRVFFEVCGGIGRGGQGEVKFFFSPGFAAVLKFGQGRLRKFGCVLLLVVLHFSVVRSFSVLGSSGFITFAFESLMCFFHRCLPSRRRSPRLGQRRAGGCSLHGRGRRWATAPEPPGQERATGKETCHQAKKSVRREGRNV